MSKVLEIDNPEGLTEILTGQRGFDEVTRPTAVQALACITAGSTPPNPAMLLGSANHGRSAIGSENPVRLYFD